MEFKESLRFLYSLQQYGIKFGLSKTENLLKAMGNPQKKLKFIHIAGTNGKGSVATYINSILTHAGYRVGLYTSPHLVSFTERMKINSKNISKSEVVYYTKIIQKIMDKKEPPTFFEAVTAMAINYFADKKVDIAILETGMGGRLDATNVITPLVSIITNISLEHQEFLGNNLIDIAREKAGIVKKSTPLISGVTQREVISMFEDICKSKQSPFFLLNRDFSCTQNNGVYNYSGIKLNLKSLESGLKGIYQKNNLAISIASCELISDMGFYIKKEDIKKGIKNSFWPGRMHIVSTSPIMMLDGAHNVDAIYNLSLSLKEFNFDKLILIIGVMADKDVKNILNIIIPRADFVIYSRPEYYRAMDPSILSTKYPKEHKHKVIPCLKDAISFSKDIASKNDLVLITGSLFTVGEALSIIDPENYPKEEV